MENLLDIKQVKHVQRYGSTTVKPVPDVARNVFEEVVSDVSKVTENYRTNKSNHPVAETPFDVKGIR